MAGLDRQLIQKFTHAAYVINIEYINPGSSLAKFFWFGYV